MNMCLEIGNTFALDIHNPAAIWKNKPTNGEYKMKNKFLAMCVKIQTKLQSEEGQDLIEYALVVALIAFAATAGMKTLATSINNAFSNIALTLNSYSG
jgi:pilus assembly protein Flp/PilA